MVAHKKNLKKHKQHGRIIATQTSALTKSPLSTKTKFLFELVCPTAQNNAWKRYTKKNWQTFTVSILYVLNNFIKNLLNAKSIELKHDLLSEQASSP